MLRSHRTAALEPVRVVVELRRDEYDAIDSASGRLGPAGYVRAVAVALAAQRGQGIA